MQMKLCKLSLKFTGLGQQMAFMLTWTAGPGAQPTQIISWALFEWNHAPVHVRLYKTKRILVDQLKSVYYFSARPRSVRSYPSFFFGFSEISIFWKILENFQMSRKSVNHSLKCQ